MPKIRVTSVHPAVTSGQIDVESTKRDLAVVPEHADAMAANAIEAKSTLQTSPRTRVLALSGFEVRGFPTESKGLHYFCCAHVVGFPLFGCCFANYGSGLKYGHGIEPSAPELTSFFAHRREAASSECHIRHLRLELDKLFASRSP